MVMTNEILGKPWRILYPLSLNWKSKVEVVRLGIPSQTPVLIEVFRTDAKSPCVTAAMIVSVTPFGPKVSWLASLLELKYIMSTATMEQ